MKTLRRINIPLYPLRNITASLTLLAIILAALNVLFLWPFWTNNQTPQLTTQDAHQAVLASIKPIMGDAPKQTNALPLLMLNLTLEGTVTGTHGFALVNTGDTTDVFRVNEDLPGGATIKGIYMDYITANYQGSLHRLNLNRELLSS